MIGRIFQRSGLAVFLAASVAWGASPTVQPTATPSPATATRIPVEHFARLPVLQRVALSPDGRQIAALHNQHEQTVLITRPAFNGVAKIVLSTDNKKFFFNWIRWVNNERLLVSIRFAARRHFTGTTETRLLSVKADGSGVINLVRAEPVRGSALGHTQTQQLHDRVIDWLPEDGQHVLLALSEVEQVLPAVYKVNVDTGARQMVNSSERDIYQWVTDAQHRVRIGIRRDEHRYDILEKAPDGKAWRTLWSFDIQKEDAVWPLGFGLDPNELYINAQHEGRAAIFSVRLDQPELPRQLRLAYPAYDVGGQLMRSPMTGEVVGLRNDGSADEGSQNRSELWAPEWRTFARSIDRALPQLSNTLIGMSSDQKTYLVYSIGNARPGEYYIGDAEHGLQPLGSTYPGLDPNQLSGKKAVRIQARDGLALDAFLTLPQGRKLEEAPRLPLILLPHGGPHSRDSLDFDYWTEFLANRGYAVLQVNFRGSVGRGKDFFLAGLKRWGLEMQDDLTDAVQWAVAKNIADDKRVCIVGNNYGGYAALMGLVKTPELYRCGISFAGVSDLQDLIQFKSYYVGGREAAERTIGLWWGDRERLRATSPALQAERIQAPVLLVHGTQDRTVPVDQSESMAKALRKANKPYRFIEQEDGDHDLSQPAHRLEFFRAMEAFLDEHLGGPR